MSMASTATTSVVHDSILGDEHNIVISLVSWLPHKAMTLFPHDSFQEQDLVELCVGIGQAHPEGVLWLSETAAVITF